MNAKTAYQHVKEFIEANLWHPACVAVRGLKLADLRVAHAQFIENNAGRWPNAFFAVPKDSSGHVAAYYNPRSNPIPSFVHENIERQASERFSAWRDAVTNPQRPNSAGVRTSESIPLLQN